MGEFREKFLRDCYFTTGQIGLQWILSEPYNKTPGARGLPIYFTRSSVDLFFCGAATQRGSWPPNS